MNNIRLKLGLLKIKRKKRKAFSLGEVLLSVFILGVTMVTISQLFVVGLKNFADTRDSIIASMLAQEGVELARNIRDNNWAKGNDSFDNLEATSAAGSCLLDTDNKYCNSNVENCFNTGCRLYYKNGKYSHDASGSRTKFRRSVKINYVGGSDYRSAIVSVRVKWGDGYFGPFSNCTINNKCVFSMINLTQWGK